MNDIENEYYLRCSIPSDINEHLPTLFNYATKCESIFESGVRGVVSTWAFAYGLLKNKSKNKVLFLNDLNPCDVAKVTGNCIESGITVDHIWINNLDIDLNRNFDLLFIDTWHVYGQLKRELNKFHKNINKYIIMHDTSVDEWDGETIRIGWNPYFQSEQTGIPVEEITRGLWPAICEFLAENPEWYIEKRYPNNNGLTILARRSLT